MERLKLRGFIRLSNDGPQILVPYFSTSESANQFFIQSIAADGLVDGFEPIHSLIDTLKSRDEIWLQIGDEAIFALIDENSKIISGRASEIYAHCHSTVRSLREGAEGQLPSVAADIVILFPDAFTLDEANTVFRDVYTGQSAYSKRAASAWRDGVAIPGLIRTNEALTPGTSFFVTSQPPISTVHVDSETPDLHVARVIPYLAGFKIDQIRVKKWGAGGTHDDPIKWILIGQGGVARYVICREPFDGTTVKMEGAPGEFAIATIRKLSFQGTENRSVISVTKSDVKSVTELTTALPQIVSSTKSIHNFNVRPIGFGAVSARMLSPFEVKNRLERYGSTWIISRHRLRQSPSTHGGLRASEMAARIFKNSSQCLIEADLIEPKSPYLERLLNSPNGVGVASSVNIIYPSDISSNLARLFRSCASTEIDIETASDFVVFWPGYHSREAKHHFRVLGYERTAIVVSVYQPNLSSVVGFARDVRGSNEKSFRRMCAMIMEDYNWTLRDDDGTRLFFENEGEGMIVLPIFGRRNFPAALARNRADKMDEWLITDFSIQGSDFERFGDFGKLMHFSEIGSYMRRLFGVRQYQEW